MAEAWARHLKQDLFHAYSAGTKKHGVNPLAVKVMAEVGVDMSSQHSKTISELPQHIDFEYVITLCNNAHEKCPFFPAKTQIIHAGFDDPPSLAQHATSSEEALHCYRQVRDSIKLFVATLPDSLELPNTPSP